MNQVKHEPTFTELISNPAKNKEKGGFLGKCQTNT